MRTPGTLSERGATFADLTLLSSKGYRARSCLEVADNVMRLLGTSHVADAVHSPDRHPQNMSYLYIATQEPMRKPWWLHQCCRMRRASGVIRSLCHRVQPCVG